MEENEIKQKIAKLKKKRDHAEEQYERLVDMNQSPNATMGRAENEAYKRLDKLNDKIHKLEAMLDE